MAWFTKIYGWMEEWLPSKFAVQLASIPQSRKSKYTFVVVAFASVMLVASISVILFRDRIFSPPEHIVLTFRGSTSLGEELVPTLAESFLRDELGAETTGIRVVSKDARGHTHLHVWGNVAGSSRLQVIDIYAEGSAAAFKCLAVENGGPNSCNIGMASRPVNDLDMKRYPALLNLGNRANEHVVALDGIAAIVNPVNPVNQLSILQLRAIYTGHVTNWKEVGGEDAPIDIYGRDSNSGTFEIFTERVINGDKSSDAPNNVVPLDHQLASSSMIVNSVMHSPNAIGYVSSPMIRGAKALAISDGSGPALPPTELSIVTEDYPICRRLFFYDWGTPGSLTNAFVRYVVNKPGQILVERSPFVELTPRVFPVTPRPDFPSAYKQMLIGYSKMGLSFHFSSNNAEMGSDVTSRLYNLASVNVLRLRTFLAQHGGTGNDILIIGFVDGVEGRTPNSTLAQKRAESVATSLRAIGVIVPSQNIRNFGASLPVASNETEEGRDRNRRVEVWVRKGF